MWAAGFSYVGHLILRHLWQSKEGGGTGRSPIRWIGRTTTNVVVRRWLPRRSLADVALMRGSGRAMVVVGRGCVSWVVDACRGSWMRVVGRGGHWSGW